METRLEMDINSKELLRKIEVNAGSCPNFKELERVRTNTSEFMWDPLLRTASGFEEK